MNRGELQAQLAKAEAEVERLKAELSRPLKGPLGGDLVNIFYSGNKPFYIEFINCTMDAEKNLCEFKLVGLGKKLKMKLSEAKQLLFETNIPPREPEPEWSTVGELAKVAEMDDLIAYCDTDEILSVDDNESAIYPIHTVGGVALHHETKARLIKRGDV